MHLFLQSSDFDNSHKGACVTIGTSFVRFNASLTRGFALKAAATDASLARELFFDDALSEDELARYVRRFAADSTCSLDLGEFVRSLPSKAADASGRAAWLARAPPLVVVGAARDAIVDAEGVAETARFLGTTPRVLDAPHDLMLASGWQLAADELIEWHRSLGPAE